VVTNLAGTPRWLYEAVYCARGQTADLMRRLQICEEKGSGIDKVVFAAEQFQLPAPDFRVQILRTSAILLSHKSS
jgi:predicted HTH transcriptional regulator